MHGHCVANPTRANPTRIVVEDLATAQSSALDASKITNLRWAPDGAYLVGLRCSGAPCDPLERIDVPRDLRLSLVRNDGFAAVPVTRSIASFGADGLYVVELADPATPTHGQTVDAYDPRTLEYSGLRLATDGHWTVSQVAPTATTTYVVASREGRAIGLYRVAPGRHLVLVRPIDPGVLTPVFPLAAAG